MSAFLHCTGCQDPECASCCAAEQADWQRTVCGWPHCTVPGCVECDHAEAPEPDYERAAELATIDYEAELDARASQ